MDQMCNVKIGTCSKEPTALASFKVEVFPQLYCFGSLSLLCIVLATTGIWFQLLKYLLKKPHSHTYTHIQLAPYQTADAKKCVLIQLTARERAQKFPSGLSGGHSIGGHKHDYVNCSFRPLYQSHSSKESIKKIAIRLALLKS